ncbi:MAG TPA: c-type cytochrome, partial [Longimicrobiales bacterium]|nr:c-type cytochrome [Longimicrobiales bacterium]
MRTIRWGGFRWSRRPLTLAAIGAVVGVVAAFTHGSSRDGPSARTVDEIVLRGRQLVLEHACGECHGGPHPAAEGWLAGYSGEALPGIQDFQIGPFHTYARNLTPDNVTGLGRFSERQIFNALRWGLRPGETPDVEITSGTPGEGNFPEHPAYLAPPMPWTAWRHMPDEDLWAIAAYLKRGLKPVSHRVPDSEGPPDFWAGEYTVEKYGTYPAPDFPIGNETLPPQGSVDLEKVLRGRQVVLEHACTECHGGMDNPAAKDWLVGMTTPDQEIPLGPCQADPAATPCYRARPRNLTPDDATGTGRYSERQIFNALRYGLNPRETPDVEITAGTPGQGGFPEHPKYLAPAMPWMSWRNMSDADLWALVAYLKHGVRPIDNHVDESEAPPDSWADAFTPDKIGTYPAPPFPTAREVGG